MIFFLFLFLFFFGCRGRFSGEGAVLGLGVYFYRSTKPHADSIGGTDEL